MDETKDKHESEQLTPEEKWKRATLSNNFIFYKVMRAHPDACQRLIEMLLGIKIKEIKMSAEETIAVDPDAKSVRLDVFVKDTGQMFDVEMIWRVSCQYQRTKKGQFQSLTGFDHYDIRGFNKLSYPRSMVRRKLLHYANGNQFYRKIQLS